MGDFDVLLKKIKKIDDCRPILDHYELSYKENPKNYSLPCPLPNHLDTAPSFFITPNGLYYCHGCNEKGDIITLVRELESLGFKDAVNRIAKIFGLTTEVSMSDIKYALTRLNRKNFAAPEALKEIKLPSGAEPALNYLDIVSKRVTKAQIKRYEMRYCNQGYYQGSLIVPIYFEQKLVAFFSRDFTGISESPKRYNKEAPSKYIFFNYDEAIKNPEYVVVTEGIFDALKLIRYGYNAIACLGTNLSFEKTHLLMKNWEKVYIALDNDNKVDQKGVVYNPGQRAAEAWAKKLRDELMVKNIVLPTGKDPDECTKDEFDRAFYEAISV